MFIIMMRGASLHLALLALTRGVVGNGCGATCGERARIAVVGGGPGGALTALLLARQERLDVTLFEKELDVRPWDERSYSMLLNDQGAAALIEAVANRKLFSRFLLFIAYECLLVAVKVAYQLLRDTPPFEVKLQRKRVNFLGRKIVADEPDERKEDSDDESEEDEARHPLIVHDRDPEQNLEALRNPDAYRQNLA